MHVQTWKEGDTVSKYHDEPSVVDHKVSLDPYRRESRKILEIFKSRCGHVEKASIDESFLDLSSIVKEKLLERFGDLLQNKDADLDDPLPEAPFVNWTSSSGTLVDLDEDHNEEDANDWDDVAMHIAAEFMASVRQDVKDILGYTCSAGIARNKTLAKIAAGQNKPARQTVLRNRSVQSFLNSLPFTKIRNLGGKLGAEVEKVFSTSSVKDITMIPIEELRRKLGIEHGQWLYNIVRGIDYSEVSTNTQVKSMLSAKSFRPQIDSIVQAERWMKVLTADLASRLLEDPNQRRPKTLTMHHRIPGSSKTRQAPIPRGPELNNDYLASLSMKLLLQINTEGRAFPCFNLSLGLSGFEGLESGAQDIGGFFTKSTKQDPMMMKSSADLRTPAPALPESSATEDPLESSRPDLKRSISSLEDKDISGEENNSTTTTVPLPKTEVSNSSTDIGNDGSFQCRRCNTPVVGETEQEHLDWHFAKDLARDLLHADKAARSAGASNLVSVNNTKIGKVKQKPRTNVEKGQKKLKF